MNLLEIGIPTVPLRGNGCIPKYRGFTLDIGRDKSIKAVEAAMNEHRILAVVTQKDDAVDAPTVHDLAQMGTLVKNQANVTLTRWYCTCSCRGHYTYSRNEYYKYGSVLWGTTNA